MKKLFTAIVLFAFTLVVNAQITFQFSDGIYNETLKVNAERNISNLLTEINNAANAKRDINTDYLSMTGPAAEGLKALWENVPFRCIAVKKIVQSCLEDATGYEVRQIRIEMLPYDNTYTGEIYRELTLSFDSHGVITGVRPAMEEDDYLRIMEEGNGVSDERQRREILKFVEDFRSYYVEKNITALEQIFSDEALIITGRVIREMEKTNIDGNNQKVKEKILYSKQTKQQYIKNLASLFQNNKYLAVDFQNIEVMRHSSKEGFYGVRLRQKWDSQNKQGKTYSDDGFVFLLWDFTDEANPKIHVRQWAPNAASVTQDDLLSPDDFFIP